MIMPANNNIFYHPYAVQNSVSVNGSANGVTFKDNVWSKAPGNISSTGDIIADALLKGKSGTGDFPVFTQAPTYSQLLTLVVPVDTKATFK